MATKRHNKMFRGERERERETEREIIYWRLYINLINYWFVCYMIFWYIIVCSSRFHDGAKNLKLFFFGRTGTRVCVCCAVCRCDVINFRDRCFMSAFWIVFFSRLFLSFFFLLPALALHFTSNMPFFSRSSAQFFVVIMKHFAKRGMLNSINGISSCEQDLAEFLCQRETLKFAGRFI